MKTKIPSYLPTVILLFFFSSFSIAFTKDLEEDISYPSEINCREDAKKVPHKYEDSCIYEAGAGKVITIDMRIKESHGDEELIDIPYSNLRHAGAIIQVYYTVGVWGKAQWFPIPSMNGVIVMSNGLLLPIGKWVRQGLLPGTFIRVVIFKSE